MGSLRPRVGDRANAPRWWHLGLLIGALGAGAVAAACGSDSSVATGPTQQKCQVTLAAPPASIAADGGTGSITVTTSPECPWDVSTGASWLSNLSPTSGQGNGTVEFHAAPNPLPAARDGEIVVNDNRLRVSQQAAACRLELRTAGLTIDAQGGAREVEVSALAGCSWTATTDANWIAFTTPVTRSGDGSVGISIAPNRSAARRVGTIAVSDLRFTVTQEPDVPDAPIPGCVYTITSSAQAVLPSDGAEVGASIAVASGCPWTASSSVAWIAVVTGASGVGSGTVVFSVAANPGAARTGTVTVAGQTFTISQAAAAGNACTYSIAPPDAAIAAAGGTGTVAVSTNAGCAWTASSNAAWVTVSSGSGGVGGGLVGFSVAANPGSARSSTISIAGHTFTVNQAAAPAPVCTFAISPQEASIAATGGPGAVAVTAADGCAWAATSGAAWVTVTAGANGAGTGAVAFSVAANPGAARTTTLTIAGQTFTVNQAAAPPPPCSFALDAPSAVFGVLGGSGTVTVTARSGCTWSAASTAAWIVVTSGASGTGNGTIRFTVAPNLGATRTGTITVADQTFTVTQAALLTLP